MFAILATIQLAQSFAHPRKRIWLKLEARELALAHWHRSWPAIRMFNSLAEAGNLPFGVPMSLRRVGRLAAMVLPTLLCLSCGQVYRPVVLPCTVVGIPGCPVETPPIPSGFHAVFALSANAPNHPGGALQIDVSGDSVMAETPTSDESEANLGDVPTNAAILPNDSRIFVTSAGSILPGGIDILSSFSTAPDSPFGGGFGPVTTVGFPTGSQPVFVNTVQNNAVYVANFGTNSVSAVNTSSNLVTNTELGRDQSRSAGRDSKQPQALRREPGGQFRQYLEHCRSVPEHKQWTRC